MELSITATRSGRSPSEPTTWFSDSTVPLKATAFLTLARTALWRFCHVAEGTRFSRALWINLQSVNLVNIPSVIKWELTGDIITQSIVFPCEGAPISFDVSLTWKFPWNAFMIPLRLDAVWHSSSLIASLIEGPGHHLPPGGASSEGPHVGKLILVRGLRWEGEQVFQFLPGSGVNPMPARLIDLGSPYGKGERRKEKGLDGVDLLPLG
ncbi:hypothetical protein TNCV_1028611 [Trichonephila clavipes]|nr:hypothetical protein TNCV_1028611 [Trichonephila clavipes]